MVSTKSRPNTSAKDETKILLHLVHTSGELLTQYLAALSRPVPTTAASPKPKCSSNDNALETVKSESINPLPILRDAAKLLKAHTTKISLLLLNKPFTPSAICLQLREMVHTCLPALMSAAEMCDEGGNNNAPTEDDGGINNNAPTRSRLLRAEVYGGVRRVLREMDICLKEVQDLVTEQDGASQVRTRDTLVFTGVLWDACDRLVEIESLGLAGLALRKAQQYHDQLKDASLELKQWGENDGEDGDDDDNDDDVNGDVAVHDDEVDGDEHNDDDDDDDDDDDLFAGSDRLPKNQIKLKQRLTRALDQLMKTDLLFTAIHKRRLNTFDKSLDRQDKSVRALDETVDRLKALTESVDDLATAFYELDEQEVDVQLETCAQTAREVIDNLGLDWHGREDEFTRWSEKWKDLVR